MQFIRYDFSSIARAFSDRALLRTTSDKLFQTRGAAAAAKERSPKDVFILTILPASDDQHYVSQNDDYQPSSSR